MAEAAKRVRRNAIREPEHTVAPTPRRETAHVKGHITVRGRTRKRTSSFVDSPLDIPIHEIPEGSSYEWKRFSVKGEENAHYIAAMRDQGWEPVSPKAHPNWLTPDFNQPHIIRDGMILMERPIELTQEARREMRQEAERKVREAENRLGAKDSDVEADRTKPQLVKEYGRMVVVEE